MIKSEIMFIRKINRTEKKTGHVYSEYRLVESVRTADGKVSQRLLLNLGSGFRLPEEQWKLLTKRIEEIMAGQLELFSSDEKIESQAHYYVKKIMAKAPIEQSVSQKSSKVESSFETVDVNNLQHHCVRTVGGEHVAWSAIQALQLDKFLKQLGYTAPQVAIAIGQIIGRLLNPGSELSTHEWLSTRSGLDELMDADFGMIGRDQLYRISDKLLESKEAIEQFLYQRERTLFQLSETITLYDLTNTYFEGSGQYNDKAKFGRSKEKRSDCRLVTMGLVLDGEGFPRCSEIFPGNVSEPKTLEEMLGLLEKNCESEKPMVILDAGIASEENIAWLKAQNYDFIVVSRKKKRSLPEGEKIIVKEKDEYIVSVIRVDNEKTQELELYCHSTRKAEKEQSMKNQRHVRFEEDLQKIANSLTKKNGTKATEKVIERIGRLKEKHKGIARFYDIDITKNDDDSIVTKISCSRQEETEDAGVYCLRCSRHDLDAAQIWQTYVTLTDIEAAFRCMKSELGMRPIYHQKTDRVDGHLFITLLAYHVLHGIRYQLKQKNIHASWGTIRARLNTHTRLSTTMQREDDKTVHIRKSAVPDIEHRRIYDALSLPYYPGQTLKTTY